MYEEFYGLQEKPFDLLPDAGYLYMSSGHDSAYNHLRYALQENKGFVVITGEIGSGKTILINYLLRQLPEDLLVAVINHSEVGPEQFFKFVCREFGLSCQGLDKGDMLLAFQDFILACRQRQQRVVLIVDEAQNLPDTTIEEIRLLSNLEAERELLLQIILVGQPELRQKLRQPHLRQFLQRVSVHYHLEKLSEDEVQEYIRHRLRVAGCPNSDTLFTPAAARRIWEAGGGIPRMINSLCDLALVYGYADGLETIDVEVVEAVVASRNRGGLFGELPPGEANASDRLESEKTVSDWLSAEQNSRLGDVERHLSNLEGQVERLVRESAVAGRLNLELLAMLRQSLKERRQLALSWQRLQKRYQRLYQAARTVLEKQRREEYAQSGGPAGGRQ